jgi:hypothetical protein
LVGAGVSSNGRRSVNANAGLRHGERTKLRVIQVF